MLKELTAIEQVIVNLLLNAKQSFDEDEKQSKGL